MIATPGLAQIVDHPEQHLDFSRAERRGGLVHDQHAHILGKRLRNLDDLLLADAQIAHQHGRVDRVAQALNQHTCLLALPLEVNDAVGSHLAAKVDIFGYAQIRAEIHFLIDDANATLLGLQRRAQVDRLTVHKHLAGSGLFDTCQNLH